MMESIHTGIFGEETRKATTAATTARDEDYAASSGDEHYHGAGGVGTTSYLELLDMYGDEHNNRDEDQQQAMDDWLEYVDQMHFSDGVNRSRTG